MIQEPETLSQRLAEGPLSVSKALDLAVHLGHALGRFHDAGRIHGAISPDVVILTGTGLELLPAEPGTGERVTPYTAPELLLRQAPSVRSDMFAFGAVMYEMLTGRRAFEGDSPGALAESISSAVPAPIGLAEFDRVVSTCLSKDAEGRWLRMQQVVMEIRLAAAMRRVERGAIARNEQIEKPLRAELERFESLLASRLEQYERAIGDMHRGCAQEMAAEQAVSLGGVSQTLRELRGRIEQIEPQIDVALEGSARGELAAERALGEVARSRGEVSDELRDLRDLVAAQAAVIESGRANTARIDDLVERVVEALEAIQSMVIEQREARAA